MIHRLLERASQIAPIQKSDGQMLPPAFIGNGTHTAANPRGNADQLLVRQAFGKELVGAHQKLKKG